MRGRIISIIRRLEEKVHPVSTKEKISHTVFRLTTQKEKLAQMVSKLQQRDQEMFQRCVGAQVAKDYAHAKMYANECAEIRKMAKIAIGSELALEKVVLRLQTVEEFGDILVQIAPVMEVVRETKDKISGVIPEVANELEEVNLTLSDMSIQTGQTTVTEIDVETSDEEAKRVLQESSLIAEQKMHEQFPEIPHIEIAKAHSEPESPAAIGGGYVALEDRIYRYVREHDGELNLNQCAQVVGATAEEVKEVISKLVEEGKIEVE